MYINKEDFKDIIKKLLNIRLRLDSINKLLNSGVKVIKYKGLRGELEEVDMIQKKLRDLWLEEETSALFKDINEKIIIEYDNILRDLVSRIEKIISPFDNIIQITNQRTNYMYRQFELVFKEARELLDLKHYIQFKETQIGKNTIQEFYDTLYEYEILPF